MEIVNKEAHLELNYLLDGNKTEIERQFSSYFYRYFKDFIFENPRVLRSNKLKEYSNHCKYLFLLAQADNKRVLDIGCGFGLMAIFFALFGAQEVIGIDINKEKISNFRKMLSKLKLDNVRAEIGDGIIVDYEDASFDAVIANEMVSHVREIGAFFQEIYRLLKENGAFVMRDGNNALSSSVISKARSIWKNVEYGPLDGVGLKIPYHKMRENIIATKFPKLSEKEVRLIVSKTRGFWGEKLLSTAQEFIETGIISKKSKLIPRNPITGEFCERLLNPYQFKKQLAKIGFHQIKILPLAYLKGERYLPKWLVRATYPVLLRRASGFALIAHKK